MQPETKLVLLLFAALIYLNLRFILNIIPLPDPFYDVGRLPADAVIGKHALYGTEDKKGDNFPLLRDSEQMVHDSIEFAERRKNKEHNVVVDDDKRYNSNIKTREDGEGGGDAGEGVEEDRSNGKASVAKKEKAEAPPELPDQVHDHTLHYPPWTHKASLHISRRTLMDKRLLCQTLRELGEINSGEAAARSSKNVINSGSGGGGGSNYFGSVVLDAGWWDPTDMFSVRGELISKSFDAIPSGKNGLSTDEGEGTKRSVRKRSANDPKTNNCLLCLMARACDTTSEGREVSKYFIPPPMLRYKTAKRRQEQDSRNSTSERNTEKQSEFTPFSLPVLLWSSALVPTTDIRYEPAALQGYFIHTGNALNPAFQKYQDEQNRQRLLGTVGGADKESNSSLFSSAAAASVGGLGPEDSSTMPSSSLLDSLLREAKRPHKFIWKRSEVDPDGRSFHLEGSLIDWTNPRAVDFFSKDSRSISHLYVFPSEQQEGGNQGQGQRRAPLSGFAKLFETYRDVHGFRLGGVDAVLKNVHHQSSRILGFKGHVSAEDYSKSYYRTMADAGKRVTTAINTWHRKLYERGELEEVFGEAEGSGGGGGSSSSLQTPTTESVERGGAGESRQRLFLLPPPTRDFTIFARAVDSHNKQHTFQSFAPPDAAAMTFSGDHELSFRDLRESALNIIHASYRCYSSIGTIIGAKHRTSIHSLSSGGIAAAAVIGADGKPKLGIGAAKDFVGEAKQKQLMRESKGGVGGKALIGGSSYEVAADLSQRVLALEDGLRGFSEITATKNNNNTNNEKKNVGAENARRDTVSSTALLSSLTSTHEACDEVIHSSLADQWFAFGSYLPGMFVPDRELHRLRNAFFSVSSQAIGNTLKSSNTKEEHNTNDDDPHFHHLANDNLLSLTSDHNSLIPYFAANSMQSFLFEVASLHVCTTPSASFQQYQNPHGNPYCPIKYLPHFNYKLFRRKEVDQTLVYGDGEAAAVDTEGVVRGELGGQTTKEPALSAAAAGGEDLSPLLTCPSSFTNVSTLPPIIGYERNPRTNRDHFPHILFEAPLDDYQFAVGPHFLAVPKMTLAATQRTISFPLLPPTMASVAKYGHHDENVVREEEKKHRRRNLALQRGSSGGAYNSDKKIGSNRGEGGGGKRLSLADRKKMRADKEAIAAGLLKNGEVSSIESVQQQEHPQSASTSSSSPSTPPPPPLVVGYQTPFVKYPNPYQWIDARDPYANTVAASSDDVGDGQQRKGSKNKPAKSSEEAGGEEGAEEVIGADKSRRYKEGSLTYFDGIRADLRPEEVPTEGRLFMRRGAVIPLLIPAPLSSTSSSDSSWANGGTGQRVDGNSNVLVFAVDAPQLTPPDGFAAAAVPFTFSEWRGAVATVSLQQQKQQFITHEGNANKSSNRQNGNPINEGLFVVSLNYTPSVTTSATTNTAPSSAGAAGEEDIGADVKATSSHFSVDWIAFSLTFPTFELVEGDSKRVNDTSSPPSSLSSRARSFPFKLRQRCWCLDKTYATEKDEGGLLGSFWPAGAKTGAGFNDDDTKGGNDKSALRLCREINVLEKTIDTITHAEKSHQKNTVNAQDRVVSPSSLSTRHAPRLTSQTLEETFSVLEGRDHRISSSSSLSTPHSSERCVVVRDATRRLGDVDEQTKEVVKEGEDRKKTKKTRSNHQHLQLFVSAVTSARCRCV